MQEVLPQSIGGVQAGGLQGPYDQSASVPPNILSPVKLAEVLLSPHDRELSGLMASAWDCTPSNLICDCLSILEIQAGVSLDDNPVLQEVTQPTPIL